ncbi:hypothetical protein C1T31_11135 [Hanstruepera neustonica]|uniref:Uncharacterized protein n=1 Tax=Hanstruepera neustonica TaxID=1445657 RepID=A0A2K1DXE0_9FLAO|nr:hypothetical protein [Hanstruepera neustonica]PNQ72688.1 hypothetical protein C1T31_11135 [Hanstruepera neustonica]
MILKGFKEKSIKKKLNSLLHSPGAISENSIVKSIGVLFNGDEVNDFEVFKTLADDLNVRPNKLKIIAYTENKKENLFSWNVCFNPKDIGWHGKIKNIELEEFLGVEFDLLVSFYAKDVLELKLLTALSKAKFKAGIFQEDERLNDLIVNTGIKDFSAFKRELKKYLKVFNKL